MTPALEPLRRIAAYALCFEPSDGAQGLRPAASADRILLVRASPSSGTPGAWSLPGGAVDHGENPFDTVVRETAAETGLSVSVGGLSDVLADLRALPSRGVTIHTDRLIYGVNVRGGSVRDRIGQPTDLARWVTLTAMEKLPLRPFTARALDLPPAAVDLRPDEPPEFPSFYAVPGPDGLHRAQRFAAYAVATDSRDRVLLTKIAPGYPGAGRWHLPGGGTDFGEQPGLALLRELQEETNQYGEIVELLGVASHRDAASLGPEGYPIDWHGVRAFYRVSVCGPTPPRVLDAGGSTCEAHWFDVASTPNLPVTEVTDEALRAAGMR
ncbi:MAG: NUDIX domain-containing protein [Dactylosporangium sp.]|nr:NUDIX domain-containing protein [Dactylosporangium sp.]NNJ59789.1 NUDIX domain-containing protein [Dactylosporangium sp.]